MTNKKLTPKISLNIKKVNSKHINLIILMNNNLKQIIINLILSKKKDFIIFFDFLFY